LLIGISPRQKLRMPAELPVSFKAMLTGRSPWRFWKALAASSMIGNTVLEPSMRTTGAAPDWARAGTGAKEGASQAPRRTPSGMQAITPLDRTVAGSFRTMFRDQRRRNAAPILHQQAEGLG
jgi:hypothetical protein